LIPGEVSSIWIKTLLTKGIIGITNAGRRRKIKLREQRGRRKTLRDCEKPWKKRSVLTHE
jgi:hypothetical protein